MTTKLGPEGAAPQNAQHKKKVARIHCNVCGKRQDHTIEGSASYDGSEGETWWTDTYEILRCGGCGHVTFRKRVWFSEWQHPYDRAIYEDTYFPPPLFRHQPRWFPQLDESLKEVLDEVYIALQNGLRFLATVGARTALDMVLNDKVKDIGGFAQKLHALQSGGFVSVAEREMLEIMTEAGHAAAHRGFSPEEKDLIVVMDILEAILYKVYIQEKLEKELADRANVLRAKVPQKDKIEKRRCKEKPAAVEAARKT